MSPFSSLLATALELSQEMDSIHVDISRTEDRLFRLRDELNLKSTPTEKLVLLSQCVSLSEDKIRLLKQCYLERKARLKLMVGQVAAAV